MKSSITRIATLAVAASLTAAVVAAQETKKPDETVTVSGCVERESDYRKAMDKGRGGVVGTGIGAENEFVLTGVAGSTAYELTGANEKLVAPHINHRVEITGMLKAADVKSSGKPTGGETAGSPPRGVDALSKDLRLRELEVATVKMQSATCGGK